MLKTFPDRCFLDFLFAPRMVGRGCVEGGSLTVAFTGKFVYIYIYIFVYICIYLLFFYVVTLIIVSNRAIYTAKCKKRN